MSPMQSHQPAVFSEGKEGHAHASPKPTRTVSDLQIDLLHRCRILNDLLHVGPGRGKLHHHKPLSEDQIAAVLGFDLWSRLEVFASDPDVDDLHVLGVTSKGCTRSSGIRGVH